MSFKDVVLVPCFFAQTSLQNELNLYFEKSSLDPLKTQHVDKSAYSHARKKLKYEVYHALNNSFLEDVNEQYLSKRFNGFRVLGIDGTTIKLPQSDCLEREFGVWNARNGKSSPRARVSAFFDCLNYVAYDCQLDSKDLGERQQASKNIANTELMESDLIVMDRGYASAWLFAQILAKNADFCVRMPESWKDVKEFKNDPERTDEIIQLALTHSAKKQCNKLKISKEDIKIRLVKVLLDNSEIEVLATSIHSSEYDEIFFKDLYKLRWETEENYKVIKSVIRIENFIGKTVKAIRQEFFARIFMLNISSVIRIEAQRNFDLKEAERRRKNKTSTASKINFKATLAKIRNAGVQLFHDIIPQALSRMISKVMQDLTAIVPGRSYKRTKRNAKGPFQTYSGI